MRIRLLTLKMVQSALGFDDQGKALVSVAALRREAVAGRLRVIRARPGSNSRILVREDDLERWLEGVCGKRQRALSPSAARDAALIDAQGATLVRRTR